MRYGYKLVSLQALSICIACSQPLLTNNTGFSWILPDNLADYRGLSHKNVSLTRSDRELLTEYGLQATGRVIYANAKGRRMTAEIYRFANSEGGRAAYLYLRPKGAVESPLASYTEVAGSLGQTDGAVASGVTVVERKNYVFRFRGATPSNSQMKKLLDHLPNFDSTEPTKTERGAYFVASSERIILGPVSLAHFAPRIPLSTVDFRSGAKGYVVRFETPAGPISRFVFEYPSQAVAQKHFAAFRELRGARVKLDDRRLGVIFGPATIEEADELLASIASPIEQPISFDPYYFDDAMTIDSGLASSLCAALFGLLFGTIRTLVRWESGIPNNLIALNISRL